MSLFCKDRIEDELKFRIKECRFFVYVMLSLSIVALSSFVQLKNAQHNEIAMNSTIATTKIQGPEARGDVKLVRKDDGTRLLVIKNMWVAPGAPDVHVAISSSTEGVIDDKIIDLERYEYSKETMVIKLDDNADLNLNATIIVYCRQFKSHFGHGRLIFN